MEEYENQIPPIPQTPISQESPKISLIHKKSIIFGAILIISMILAFGFLFFMFSKSKPPQTSVSVSPPFHVTPTPISIFSPTPLHSQIPVSHIAGTITLPIGQEVAIPNSSLSAQLVSNTVPTAHCLDCVTTTQIQIKDATGIGKTLTYTCGGVTGQCTIQQQLEGYTIELDDNRSSQSVVIRVHH